MKTVNITEAKTHLSQLVDEAAQGKPFIITKHGKPLVRVVGLDPSAAKKSTRVGFLKGQFLIPDDFDTMGRADIERMFGLRGSESRSE